MSFTRLLAAGRSIMGLRKKPGPYRMNDDNRLPKFPPVTRSGGGARAGGTPACGNGNDAPVPSGAAGQGGNNRRLGGRKKGLLSRLAGRLGLGGQSGNAPAPEPATAKPVQGELSLHSVKVVRNDLSDCEPVGAKSGRGPGVPLGMVWNRLSARLLRDAAREFTLVQKERGKLFSQASPGGGGAGGA